MSLMSLPCEIRSEVHKNVFDKTCRAPGKDINRLDSEDPRSQIIEGARKRGCSYKCGSDLPITKENTVNLFTPQPIPR